MRLIDISRVHQDAPLYPDSVRTVITRLMDINDGDEYTLSKVSADTHAGTHADAFNHYIKDATTVDAMPLELFYGPCRVVTFPENRLLTKADLLGKIEGAARLVIHGGGLTYLGPDAAQYILDCGIRCIVTDAWSVAPPDNERQIHVMLLSARVGIVENVILDGMADGAYTLIAFPAKYGGADGAPVRAVLMAE